MNREVLIDGKWQYHHDRREMTLQPSSTLAYEIEILERQLNLEIAKYRSIAYSFDKLRREKRALIKWLYETNNKEILNKIKELERE